MTTVSDKFIRELRQAVGGEVHFDAGSRAAYSTDSSNYRQLPHGVVLPRTAADIERAVATCHAHGVAVLIRGAGTSTASWRTDSAAGNRSGS